MQFCSSSEQPFVLKADLVRKLWDSVSDGVGESASAEIRCSDDSVRNFDQLEPLLTYENPPNRRITRLTIRSWLDSRANATVVFRAGSELYRSPVHINVEGPDDTTESLYSSLKELVRGGRPWYWIAARRMESLPIVFGILVVYLYFLNRTSEEAANGPTIVSIAFWLVGGPLY